MSTLLNPLIHLVAAILATSHSLLAQGGIDPDSAVGWILAIVSVVLTLRVLLLPLTVRSVRLAHASAAARPHLERIRRAYAGRTDRESLIAMRNETLAVQREHGISAWGVLPTLAQLPVLLALYEVLIRVTQGHPVGAMDAALATSLGSATLLGVGLAQRAGTDWAGHPARTGVILGLALTSAALTYATQTILIRPNTVIDGMPEAVSQAQGLLPAISAIGVLVSASAVPAGVLVYWIASNAWTFLQQAIITTWFPTPGTPAHTRLLQRRTTTT